MQTSHAGKQSYKNALSFFFFSLVYLSVHPLSSACLYRQESLIAHCLSKRFFPVLVGGNESSHIPYQNIHTPSFLQVFDSISWCQMYLSFAFLFIFLFSPCWTFFCSETSSAATDSRFVYQNIDFFFFSLYTSTLGPFLLVAPCSPQGSPDGPSLSWHWLASEAVVGSKRDKRETGQYSTWDSCVYKWQCSASGFGEAFIWLVHLKMITQNFQLMDSFYMT